MKFSEAYVMMRDQNYHIKLPDWSGYWAWENDTIMIHTKEGEILDIRDTKNTRYTFDFMMSDDWIAFPMKDGSLYFPDHEIKTFDFSEACRRIMRGERISNKDWVNGDFVYLVKESRIEAGLLRNEAAKHVGTYLHSTDIVRIEPHIDRFYNYIKAIKSSYEFSQSEIMSNDWMTCYDRSLYEDSIRKK